MRRCQHSFKKIPSNLRVVCAGSNSFQGISYVGKPQVVSSFILSNLWASWAKLMPPNQKCEQSGVTQPISVNIGFDKSCSEGSFTFAKIMLHWHLVKTLALVACLFLPHRI